MPVGLRFNGVDFDDLFDPGTLVASSLLKRADGQPVQYAARGSVPKRADVGLRVGGSDVSNLWLPKGSAPAPLPIPAVNAIAAARSGATGSVTSRIVVTIANNGTYSVNTEYVNANETGEVIAAGTWLLPGTTVGDYEVQFVGTAASPGVVNNGATTYVSCTTTRAFTFSVSVPAASSQDESAAIPSFEIRIRRAGTAVGVTNTSLFVQATGYL